MHGLMQRQSHVVHAMFDNLSRSLEKAWDMVKKDGKLTSENIKGPMREIRRALLEADVSRDPTFSPSHINICNLMLRFPPHCRLLNANSMYLATFHTVLSLGALYMSSFSGRRLYLFHAWHSNPFRDCI